MSERRDEAEELQHDPQVLRGDDEGPRQPASPLDPYTPEPGPRAGDRRAFRSLRLALVVVVVVIAIVVYAAFR